MTDDIVWYNTRSDDSEWYSIRTDDITIAWYSSVTEDWYDSAEYSEWTNDIAW